MAQHLEKLGWCVLYRGARIAGVQVDLLCRNPAGILTIIEVKGQSAGGLARISARQRHRLFRASGFLAEWEAVEMLLALVDGSKVGLLPVDALTGG